MTDPESLAARSVVRGERVEITRFEPRHLPALVDFYRDTWDAKATEESVARARAQAGQHNVAVPGEEPPTWLFLKGGRILGHVTTIPVQLWTNGANRPAYWFIGFMVRAEHRNGPVGFLMLREAVKELEITLSLTVQPVPRKLFKSLGFTELGLIPNYIRPLRAGHVLANLDLDALGLSSLPNVVRHGIRLARLPGVARLAGLVGQMAIDAWGVARSAAAGRLRVTTSASLDRTALDQLWLAARERLSWSVVRDGTYLAGRYAVGVEDVYRAVTVHDGNVLAGVALVRAPRGEGEGDARLRGIKIATLSDLVVDPARRTVALKLLRGAERIARDLGADALLCSASHRAVAPLLRDRGYLRFPGNLYFLVRDSGRILPGASTLEDWWLTRGDMNADSVF